MQNVLKTYLFFCFCPHLIWNNLLFTTPNSWKSFRKPCKKLFSGLSFHKSCFQQLFSKKTKVVFSSFFQGSEKYVRYSLNTQQVYMSNHSIWYMYSHKCVHMAATNPGYSLIQNSNNTCLEFLAKSCCSSILSLCLRKQPNVVSGLFPTLNWERGWRSMFGWGALVCHVDKWTCWSSLLVADSCAELRDIAQPLNLQGASDGVFN